MWRRTGGSLSGWVAFVGTLAFYVCSLAPGVEYWDTGELQTDANALFIAHPTGFPLFILGGWAFAHLFALGDPAWRVSLFSAIAVATAAAMLAALLHDLTRDVPTSIVAALIFAPVEVVWITAVRADAHDLALALVTVAVVFAVRAMRTRDRAPLRASAGAWGAALATHPVALFAFPALVVLAWPALAPPEPRKLAILALWCVVPLVAYAYVPLRSIAIERSGTDPSVALGLHGSALVDDGAPSNAASFAHYVLATRFAPGDAVRTFVSGPGFAHVLAFAHVLLYDGYGLLALAVALVGFGAMLVRAPRIGLALAVLALGSVGFAASYTIESVPERYALPALWSISACLGYGAWWLARSIVQRARPATVAACALLAVSLVPTYSGARDGVRERARHGDARLEAEQVARATVDGSVIVAEWTYATPLAYAKYVRGELGARRIVSGWPPEYDRFYRVWRKRYGHVYFVLDGQRRGYAFGTPRYVAPERAFVVSEYAGL
jgi:hypothetical protein